MKTEGIAWFIVGAIVILFFIGKSKKKTVAVSCSAYPNEPSPSPQSGDSIAGTGTIAAGTPEIHTGLTGIDQAPLKLLCGAYNCCHMVARFPIDRFPVPVINQKTVPPSPIRTPSPVFLRRYVL